MRLYFLLLFHSRAVNGLFQRQGAFPVPNLPGGDQQTAAVIRAGAGGQRQQAVAGLHVHLRSVAAEFPNLTHVGVPLLWVVKFS